MFNPTGRLLCATAIIAAALASGCSTPPPVEAPPLSATARAAVAAYLRTHSVTVPGGWQRGVLVASRKEPYPCIGGTCWTWTGTAATDTAVVTLRSVDNASAVFDIVQTGDDFLWTEDPHPSYSGEVRVLTHGAVSAPA